MFANALCRFCYTCLNVPDTGKVGHGHYMVIKICINFLTRLIIAKLIMSCTKGLAQTPPNERKSLLGGCSNGPI